MTSAVGFTVPGNPVPQGSLQGFIMKTKAGPRAGVKAGNQGALEKWRGDVRSAALATGHPGFGDRSVAMRLVCYLPRSKGHFGTGKNAEVLKESAPKYPKAKSGPSGGDAEKLARAVADALTNVLFEDDTQIAKLLVEKYFVEVGEMPRAVIALRDLEVAE